MCMLKRIVQTIYENPQILHTLDNIPNELPEVVGYTGSKMNLVKP